MMSVGRRVADIACVVPTHDRSALLATALRAIAAQTVLPREVIVVDDSDAPPPADVIAPADGWPFPLTLVSNPGHGASSSRNLGAHHATSALIAFLDDDDWWAPEYLRRAEEVLDQTGADAAITWLMRVDVDGTTFPGRAIPPSLQASDVVAVNPGMTGSNLVIRRQALDQISGFDAALPTSNDKDLLVRFLDADLRYAVVPQRLAFRREHAMARLSSPSPDRLAGLLAYEAKHDARLSPAQRWQLRAKRARADLRCSGGMSRRVVAAAHLLQALALGGMAEGMPLPLARAVARLRRTAAMGMPRRPGVPSDAR